MTGVTEMKNYNNKDAYQDSGDGLNSPGRFGQITLSFHSGIIQTSKPQQD